MLLKTDDMVKVSDSVNEIKDLGNVATVSQAMPSKDNDYQMITVIPKTDTNDVKTKKLVHKIRDLNQKRVCQSYMLQDLLPSTSICLMH